MTLHRFVSLAAMITLALICASCGYTIRMERNYPSAYSHKGVHRVAPIERTVFRGTYLWNTGHGMKLIAVQMLDRRHYGPDTSTVLSDHVTMDEYGNYVVVFKGDYPTTLVPRFAANRIIVPVYVYTTNGVDTDLEFRERDLRKGKFTIPACSGQMMLFPPSTMAGYDLYVPKRIGGGLEHFEVPDPGCGPLIAQNGYPVTREILVQSYVERGCTNHRPIWK